MWSTIAAIIRVQWRVEMRQRVLLWQVAPFAVMALVITGLAANARSVTRTDVGPGLVYVVLVFTTLLLIGRLFSAESSSLSSPSFTMLAIDGSAAYLGTVIALAVELLVVTGVVVAISGLLFHFSALSLLVAAPSIVVTIIDLTTLGVLFGALAARPGQSAALLPLIALPSFTPVIIEGERLLTAAVTHHGAGQWWGLLILMSAVYGGIGVLLYGVIGEL